MGNTEIEIKEKTKEIENKEITFNAFRWEFGNAISCGLLFPYNMKRSGWHVSVCSRMVFPKEWWSLWFDDFSNKAIQNNSLLMHDKRQMERFIFGTYNLQDFRPLPLPTIKRNISDKYVVFIPTIPEMAYGNPHKLNLCLPLDCWKSIADFIRSKKIKVVAFSSHESCPKKISSEMSDIFFHAEKKDLNLNIFLKNQLEWMANSETSISFGGAFHLPYCFDIPGMGFDGQMLSNYAKITKSYRNVRNNLLILPSLQNISIKWKLDNRNSLYVKYTDIVLENLEKVLI